MKRIGKPQALPGSCLICGNGSREFYIDLEIHMEFHGRLYLCNICSDDLVKLMGAMTVEQAEDLRGQNEVLKDEVYNLGVMNDGLERAVNELTVVRKLTRRNLSHPSLAEGSEDEGGQEGSADSGSAKSPRNKNVAGLRAVDPFDSLKPSGA